MNEVMGDADPPAREGRPLDDNRPAFDDFDDRYGEFDDGFDAGPGPVLRFVAKVATPESLSIAAIVVATASLLDLPAIGDTVNALSVSREFDPAFIGRINSGGQFIVAAIGFALAISARRRKPVHDQPESRAAPWVPAINGGALIIAAVSAVLAIVAFLVAGTAHRPRETGFPSVTSVPPHASVSAEPAPAVDQGSPPTFPGPDPASPTSAIASFVLIDPSSGAQVAIDPSSGALVTINPSPTT